MLLRCALSRRCCFVCHRQPRRPLQLVLEAVCHSSTPSLNASKKFCSFGSFRSVLMLSGAFIGILVSFAMLCVSEPNRHVCMARNAICCIYTVFRVSSTQVCACTVSVTYLDHFSSIRCAQSIHIAFQTICLTAKCICSNSWAICGVVCTPTCVSKMYVCIHVGRSQHTA